MDFRDKPHLLQLLKDFRRWPNPRVALMVGAGMSLNATQNPGANSSFSTWRQLARAMYEEMYPPQPGSLELTSHREESFCNASFLKIAQEYEATFSRNRLDELVRQHNPDSDYRPSKLHELLLQLPWADVFTTNYDTLLERTDLPGRPYQTVTTPKDLTRAIPPRIVKLHGSFGSNNFLVITEEDYRRYPKDSAPFVNTVQQSLIENTFVLIGFSGDDPNFLQWTGWIRDELGDDHAPIYLVGPLSLGNGERLLLARRGVTPIDLTPVFSTPNTLQEKYAASIEWFLSNLTNSLPARAEKWQEAGRPTAQGPKSLGPLLAVEQPVPEGPPFPSGLDVALEEKTAAQLLSRWRFLRKRYPGWIIAPEESRSRLWRETERWIYPLLKSAKDWTPQDRILLSGELIWRLETAMVPLLPFMAAFLEAAIDDSCQAVSEEGSAHQWSSTIFAVVERTEFIDAWASTEFALLRDARESYNGERWNRHYERLATVIDGAAAYTDRSKYEEALWLVWNMEREKAEDALAKWAPSPQTPLAALWKAGLLAELDHLGEAKLLLRSILQEIRRAQGSKGQSVELLSLEGWCTYLLFAVGSAESAFDRNGHRRPFIDFAERSNLLNEFADRWQALKGWECDPWTVREYFEQVLAGAPPKPAPQEKTLKSFDPGETIKSRHLGGDDFTPLLPAFGYFRMFEKAGIPLRMPAINIAGETLANACRWTAPYADFMILALLIRAGQTKVFRELDFLSRTRVAAMNEPLVQRLGRWCLGILKQESRNFSQSGRLDPWDDTPLEVLLEVLSRLAFRMDPSSMREGFATALSVFLNPASFSHRGLSESLRSSFKRLFDAADEEVLSEWLPSLIGAPLPAVENGSGLPMAGPEFDPILELLQARRRLGKNIGGNPQIGQAVSSLERRIFAESGKRRASALARLVCICDLGVMTARQEGRLGKLLWEQRRPDGLPDFPLSSVVVLWRLPHPPKVDTKAVARSYILSLGSDGFVHREEGMNLTVGMGGHPRPLIQEVFMASKPLIQLADEAKGELEWTLEESRGFLIKAKQWWANDKVALEQGLDPFGISDSIRGSANWLGDFVARAVLPYMRSAAQSEWQEILAFLRELREYSVFPDVALPYLLVHRTAEAEPVLQTLLSDLKSATEGAVSSAARATRHWIHLVDAAQVPMPSPMLLSALVERICFRRKPGLTACIRQLTNLIGEKGDAISNPQAELLTSSLMPWNLATSLPMAEDEQGDFAESERPDVRTLVARLARALEKWHKERNPDEPTPSEIELWRDACVQSPLPEIRRVWAGEGS